MSSNLTSITIEAGESSPELLPESYFEHQLHVLGVSASGRDAGCERRDSEMALLK